MNRLEKEFVPFQEALELKELGFNEPCFGYYYTLNGKDWKFAEKSEYYKLDDEINIGPKFSLLAPTFSQCFRWFREKYNLRGFIGFRPNVKKFGCHVYDMSLSGMEYVKQRTMEEFNKDPLVGTYEEAELACLRKLIEIVKTK